MKYKKLTAALALSAMLAGTVFVAAKAEENSDPPGVEESKKDDGVSTFKPDKDSNVTYYDWHRVKKQSDLPTEEPKWNHESSKGLYRCLLLWNPSHYEEDDDDYPDEWFYAGDGFSYMHNDDGEWNTGVRVGSVGKGISPDADSFATKEPLTPLVIQKSGNEADIDKSGHPSSFFLGVIDNDEIEPTSYTTTNLRPSEHEGFGVPRDGELTGNTQVYRNLRILYATTADNKWSKNLHILDWTDYFKWGKKYDGRLEGTWSGHSWAESGGIKESHLFKRKDGKGIVGEDNWIVYTKDCGNNFAGIKDEDDVKLCSIRLAVLTQNGLNALNYEAWLVNSWDDDNLYMLKANWDDDEDGDDQSGFRMFIGTQKTMPAITSDYTVKRNCTFRIDEGCVIPEKVTLTVEEGGCLIVGGSLMNSGRIINNGSIVVKDKGVIQPFMTGEYSEDDSPSDWNHGSLNLNPGSSLLVMRGGKVVCGEYRRSMLRLNSATIDNYGYIATNSMSTYSSKITCEEGSKFYIGWEKRDASGVLNYDNVDFSSPEKMKSGGLKASYVMEGAPGTIKSVLFSKYSTFRYSWGGRGTPFAHGYLRYNEDDQTRVNLVQGKGSYDSINDCFTMGDSKELYISKALWSEEKIQEEGIGVASSVKGFRYVAPKAAM